MCLFMYQYLITSKSQFKFQFHALFGIKIPTFSSNISRVRNFNIHFYSGWLVSLKYAIRWCSFEIQGLLLKEWNWIFLILSKSKASSIRREFVFLIDLTFCHCPQPKLLTLILEQTRKECSYCTSVFSIFYLCVFILSIYVPFYR